MKLITSFFLNLIVFAATVCYAQQPVGQDSIPDSTLNVTKTDTLPKKSISTSSSLNSEVIYSSDDSMHMDIKNNIVHLYGNARVKYEDFELDAEYIRLDQNNKKIFASGIFDRNGRYRNRPIFKQGSEPPATTDSLLFNIETKKGLSFGGSYDIEGGYIQAARIKKNEFNEGFIKDATYSTCNLQHPHFGIHISKGIVTKNQIITKVAYLEVGGIPLPIGVPFGFFPKTNKRASGILFPTFGEEGTRGFFMRDLGYYIGFNDYWDLAAYSSLYSNGSYEVRTQSRYQKRYKYDGSIGIRFSSLLPENAVEGTPGYKPQRDFNIMWSHSQRPEVNPGTSFSAQVNVGTSSYFQNTAAGGTYDIDQLTRNSMSSSINYSKSSFGPNGIFSFSSSLAHRQEIQSGSIYLELPRFNLSMTTINPFDSKNRVGEQKWYQRINVGYNMDGSNSVDTKDSLLFKRGFKDFRNSIQHNVPIGFSTNVLKFFQFSTGGTYRENWYLQTYRERFSNALNGVVRDTIRGFSRVYEYGISASLSTKVYGTKAFKRGKVMAIRHVLTPSFGVSYRPDFGSDRFGFYRNVPLDSVARNVRRYSIFEPGGAPSPGKQANLNFSFDNNIEAKVRSTKDTVNNFVKVPILQGLSFNGYYNFVADSFKLSTISFSGRTSFFKQKVGLNFRGTFDPYVYEGNRRIDKLSITQGKLAKLTDFGVSTDYSLNLNSNAIKNRNTTAANQSNLPGGMTPQQADQLKLVSRDPNGFVDFNVPWDLVASYSFNLSYNAINSDASQPKTTIVSTMNVNGNVNVTPKWKIGYATGYDFNMKDFNITQFTVYRDLHCWDLSFSWIPFGPYKSYTMDLRVRSSILQDLKLSRRKSHFDSF